MSVIISMSESVHTNTTTTEDFSQTGPYDSDQGLYTPLPGDEHETQSTYGTVEGVLYDDIHVSVNQTTGILTVKHYVLLKPTLRVPIDKIIWIAPAPEVITRKDLRPWGSGLTGIFWARDFSRGGAIVGPKEGFQRSFVFKSEGDIVRSGFSVQNVEEFSEAMNQVVSGVMHRRQGE